MSVTKQLLDLFNVDKQLRGLQGRLEAAERFLNEQSKQLAELEKQKATQEAQHRQFKAAMANEEGEASRLEAKMASLREQMNTAKTAKEYNAFLSELNTFKEHKSAAENRALELMSRVEEINGKLSVFGVQYTERTTLVTRAKADRDTKAGEIKDRVSELRAQRAELAAKLPAAELTRFEDLVRIRGDEAMAPVEVLDRRAHEGNCSSCMMAIPVEVVSGLMSGRLVNCPSCRCILYVEEEAFKKKDAIDVEIAKTKRKTAPRKAPVKKDKPLGKAKPEAAANGDATDQSSPEQPTDADQPAGA